jgi:hypothetical protein
MILASRSRQKAMIAAASAAAPDRGGDDLALRRVRDADDVRLDNVGVLEQHLFDLERRDVDAPHLDHLLEAAPKAHPPVAVDRAEIAGEEPAALVKGCGIQFGCAIIARGHIAFNDQFADFVRRQCLAMLPLNAPTEPTVSASIVVAPAPTTAVSGTENC